MAIGALTLGQRVTNTVGKSLTTLDLSGALSAQVSAAFFSGPWMLAYTFKNRGMPASIAATAASSLVASTTTLAS